MRVLLALFWPAVARSAPEHVRSAAQLVVDENNLRGPDMDMVELEDVRESFGSSLAVAETVSAHQDSTRAATKAFLGARVANTVRKLGEMHVATLSATSESPRNIQVPRNIRFESVHVLSLNLPLAKERRKNLLGMFHDRAGSAPGPNTVLPTIDYGVSVTDDSVRALWSGSLPAAMKAPFIKQALGGLPVEDVQTWLASFDALHSHNKSDAGLGPLCCALGHRYIWHAIAQQAQPESGPKQWYLVLEDDAKMNPMVERNIWQGDLAKVPIDAALIGDADLMFLESRHCRGKGTLSKVRGLNDFKSIYQIFGTTAYAVTPAGAKILYENSMRQQDSPKNSHIDHAMNVVIQNGMLTAYCPAMYSWFIESGAKSEIKFFQDTASVRGDKGNIKLFKTSKDDPAKGGRKEAATAAARNSFLVKARELVRSKTSSGELKSDCHTAVPGEECHGHVQWAMSTGVREHPEWYGQLTADSPFEAFQEVVRHGQSSCQRPCQRQPDLVMTKLTHDHKIDPVI